MKTLKKTILLTLPLCLITLAGHAQNYSIDWYDIAGGGGASTGGQYSLSGAIGQPDAGAMAGGGYSLSGGFLSNGFTYVGPSGTPPVFRAVTQTNGTITLTWSATAGQTYQVQYKTSLSQPGWTSLVTVTATNSTASASDALSSSAQRFYRIVWLP